jgi:hypothetical protein
MYVYDFPNSENWDKTKCINFGALSFVSIVPTVFPVLVIRSTDRDTVVFLFIIIVKGKGKATPLQPLTGPDGSRSLGSQILRQSAHEGGKVVSPTHRPPLPPGNIPGTHFC